MGYGKITAKQQEILDYLKTQVLSKGYPPSVREICEAVHLKSTSSVHSHLETLEKNGYIRRDPTKPRAIEIVDDEFNITRRELVSIPVVGTVAAGEPIFAVENISEYFPIPAEYMPNEETFMLVVKGDSMINVGVYSGDKIIVKKCSTASNGDMVVAMVDDSATVKTFYKEIDGAKEIINRAHELRNANPMSHSSAGLIDKSTTSNDIKRCIEDLNSLIDNYRTIHCR